MTPLITTSLLDTDLYKFTMWQMLHRHPLTKAKTLSEGWAVA